MYMEKSKNCTDSATSIALDRYSTDSPIYGNEEDAAPNLEIPEPGSPQLLVAYCHKTEIQLRDKI